MSKFQNFSNKLGYESYLLERPDLLKKIRGKDILVTATVVMNHMLYKRRFCTTDKGKKHNRVYVGSLCKYFPAISDELISKTVRQLIKLGELEKDHGDLLTIPDRIPRFLQWLTDHETDETIDTLNNQKTLKTGNIVENNDNSVTDEDRPAKPNSKPSFLNYDKIHSYIKSDCSKDWRFDQDEILKVVGMIVRIHVGNKNSWSTDKIKEELFPAIRTFLVGAYVKEEMVERTEPDWVTVALEI